MRLFLSMLVVFALAMFVNVQKSNAQCGQSVQYVQSVQCGGSVLVIAPQEITWNPECALQAGKQFLECKQAGGSRWACVFRAGLGYIECSGGLAAAQQAQRGGVLSRMKTRQLGRRSIRQCR